MALNSIYGRTTNSIISGTLLRATTSSINDMFVTQQQIASGNRILTTSMDPLGAAEFMRYSNRSARNETYLSTIGDLKSNYNFIDSQVGEGVDIANQLRQIALRESNDGASDSETRSLSVTEVSNLQAALLAMANAEKNGQSLFAGSNTTVDAFTAFGDALMFNGDFAVNQRNIEDGLSFNTSLTADQVFGNILTTSAARNDLNVALNLATVSPTGSAQVSTPLSSLNGGRGVDLDVLTIVVLPDGNANPSSGRSYTADLRGAKTIADVAEILNNVRGDDGNPVFDVDTYEGFSTNFPQEGMSKTAGLKITAVGEAANAIQGRASQ
ncbi:MAG: hypothetical protein KDB07_11515, partial [Planctomycetes bacterium]|nr:hypothetical protein [Planctomycetota bacterium]